MSGYDVLLLVMRWLHILAAITAVGGSLFIRFALAPGMAGLGDEQRKTFFEPIRRRWARMIAIAIAGLLISGLANFIVLVRAAKTWETPLPAYYHPVFGVKFLLALGIFFLASALAGSKPATARFRENARLWMTVNVGLAILVVCLSGVLRMSHVGPNDTNRQGTAMTPADE